ncbi:MAG: beta-glucosidase, partial [Clostridiales bacterium]|nr:beta-glucosidase [Clostridiales bacterium]
MKKWARILFQPGTPLGENGVRATASKEHILLSKNAAEEGMVLLKNENQLLPFARGSRIALFGKGTFDYVKGGGGSGDVTVSYVTNLFDGFSRLGNEIIIEPGTTDYYKKYVHSKYAEGAQPGLIAEPGLPDELIRSARSFTDTAVITISRFSGEGWDRSVPGQRIPEDRGLAVESGKLFERGDFYLSDAENAMVQKVLSSFPRVAVVLNVGGMVDTEWFRNDPRVQAVLIAWQGGMEGGLAAAELLCGIKSPCGKLSDTFARDLTDYPGTAGFHTSDDYVEYTEDIYVGYRYFETIPGKKELVNYPFGFGLSYTSFNWTLLSAAEKNGEICISVSVTNTGDTAGKEVIQVYFSAPQG